MSVHNERLESKVEAVKEIRQKTLQLEELKTTLVEEIEACDREQERINEFKNEMDVLLQDKMSHVEELRQIHNDLNTMENALKKAEESKASAVDRIKQLHEKYESIQIGIDSLRRDTIGLEKLPEFGVDPKLINPELLSNKNYEKASKGIDWFPTIRDSVMMTTGFSPAAYAHSFHPATSSLLSHLPLPLELLPSTCKIPESRKLPATQPPLPGPSPTFRQQPPPMKSCSSCHQQIHRNAPICPLCKAKSRSRNPKKPKKKD